MKRIFIAEDQQSQADFLRVLFEAAGGYEVTFFSDGLELYNHVLRDKPDLMILDVLLPSLSGLAVARLLRYNEPFKHIPIIVVTSITDAAIGERARKAGADVFFSKPLAPKSLMSEVDRLMAF